MTSTALTAAADQQLDGMPKPATTTPEIDHVRAARDNHACPTCKAAAGSPCRRPSGHNVFGGDVHAPRRKLAEAAAAAAKPEASAEVKATARKRAAAKTPAGKAAAKTGNPAGAKAPAPAANGAGRPPSVKDAAEQVLREAAGPLHIAEIAKQVIDRQLAPKLQGKTPAATIGARVAVDAREKGRFVRTSDPATFDLRELNPRGARKRPAATPEKGEAK